MNRPGLAAVALLTSALVLTGGAATAAQKSAKDASGDAAPAADITRVTVKNSEKTLAIHVKLHKASAGRTHVVATLTPTAEGAATYVARTVVTGKKVGATLETSAPAATGTTDGTGTTDATGTTDGTDSTGATPVDCKGIRASVSSGRNGQVVIRIPQSCFGADAGTLVAAVTTATAAGDVADETGTLRVKQG